MVRIFALAICDKAHRLSCDGVVRLNRRMQVRQLLAIGLCVVGVWAPAGCRAPLPPRDRAIERAVAYLKANEMRLEPSVLLLADYLRRRYRRDDLALLVRHLKPPRAEDDELPVQQEAFYRLFDGRWRWPQKRLKQITFAVDRLSVEAIYCDQWGTPPDFSKRVREHVLAGGYAATHAVLAMQWAVENGCVARKDAERLLENLMPKLVQVVEEDGEFTDKAIEMIGILGYLGRGDVIKPEWLQAVLDGQREDGGWAKQAALPESNGHTTMVALWCLLEAKHGDFPAVSWIPRVRK